MNPPGSALMVQRWLDSTGNPQGEPVDERAEPHALHHAAHANPAPLDRLRERLAHRTEVAAPEPSAQRVVPRRACGNAARSPQRLRMPPARPTVILRTRRDVDELRTPATESYVMGADGLTALVEALRQQGYRRALEKAGIPFDKDLVRIGGYRADSARTAARELLDTVAALEAVAS